MALYSLIVLMCRKESTHSTLFRAFAFKWKCHPSQSLLVRTGLWNTDILCHLLYALACKLSIIYFPQHPT